MNHDVDEKEIREQYKSLQQESNLPSAELEKAIQQAAYKAISSDKNHSQRVYQKKWFIPVSIAASILFVSTVVLQLTFTSPVQNNQVNDLKRPMFLLQRSKPAAPADMLKQLDQVLATGRLDRARQLHQKFKYFYPEHEIPLDLDKKLKAENIY